jgi:serine/threonine protein phosphatase PrpC
VNPQPPRRTSARSERLYRALLRAYPRAFREEYAGEMLLVFRDASRGAVGRRGTAGLLALWGNLLWDLAKTVPIQHLTIWRRQREGDLALAGKERIAMALSFKLEVAQRTDIGRTRESNEDNLLAVVPEDDVLLGAKGALFVVSDGLGGHGRGEVASELAVRHIRDAYYQDARDDVPAVLREAVERANAAVYQAGEPERARGEQHGMGATCVAAVLRDQTLYAANVGDSRVYILHEGALRQVTRDHSLVAQMVARGEITPDEARTHEQRHIIYRSLGQPQVEVDLFSEPMVEGDTLILCTDGLCGVVTDDDLRAIVERYGPDEGAQQLIARANEAGGPDNVTAIVVRVAAA